MATRLWTDNELFALIVYHINPDSFDGDLEDQLPGRGRGVIEKQCQQLGLTLDDRRGRAWMPNEQKFIADFYDVLDPDHLARCLGRTEQEVILYLATELDAEQLSMRPTQPTSFPLRSKSQKVHQRLLDGVNDCVKSVERVSVAVEKTGHTLSDVARSQNLRLQDVISRVARSA